MHRGPATETCWEFGMSSLRGWQRAHFQTAVTHQIGTRRYNTTEQVESIRFCCSGKYLALEELSSPPNHRDQQDPSSPLSSQSPPMGTPQSPLHPQTFPFSSKQPAPRFSHSFAPSPKTPPGQEIGTDLSADGWFCPRQHHPVKGGL